MPQNPYIGPSLYFIQCRKLSFKISQTFSCEKKKKSLDQNSEIISHRVECYKQLGKILFLGNGYQAIFPC